MSDSDFTLVTTSSHHKVFNDFETINSATGFNPDTSLQAALRRHNPDLALTVTTSSNGTFSTVPPPQHRLMQ